MKKDITKSKPASLTTTIRNPERIYKLFKIVSKYNGEILTDKVIDKIFLSMIEKNFITQQEKTKIAVQKIIAEKECTYIEAYRIYEKNKSSPRKYKNWKKGLNSRFFTYIEIFLLFGLIHLEENKQIEIKINTEEFNNSDVFRTKSYLQNIIKYQTNNIYKSSDIGNKVNLLPLFLKLINTLGYVNKKEISIFSCTISNDKLNDIHNDIKKYREYKNSIDVGIRKKEKEKLENDCIYKICLERLGVDIEYDSNNNLIENKKFKYKTILKERQDDLYRKFYFTGIFYDNEENKISIDEDFTELSNYIIDNYLVNKYFADRKYYFEYMNTRDSKIDQLFTVRNNDNYNLDYWFNKIGEKNIYLSLEKMNLGLENNLRNFENVSNPLMLEFLTSVLLHGKYKGRQVITPHYKINKLGYPKFTAPAGVPDIDIKTNYGTVEVTMMKARNQLTHEIPSIYRHATKLQYTKAIFIAPQIHEDSMLFIDFLSDKKKFHMTPFTIQDIINKKGLIL